MSVGTINPGGLNPSASRAGVDLGNAYLALLGIVLAGYALLGKGFAYFGAEPLLVAEVTLLLGVLAMHRTGCAIAGLVSFPSLVLLALFLLFLNNALKDVPVHGLSAIRDAIVVFYGMFAFIVIAHLLEDPSRLGMLFRWFMGFGALYAVVGVAMAHLTIQLKDVLPNFPGTEEPFIAVRLGEAAVHLGGIAAAYLLGMRRASGWVVLVLTLSFFALMPSRGAMIAFLACVTAAAIIGGRVMRFVPGIIAAILVFCVAYAIDLNVQINADRAVGARQFVSNIESVFGSSDYSNLDGTKEWRLAWWTEIIRYTFFGEFFWTGKGFGMSLAEADGFVVGLEHGGPVLRSPHNVSLTILARAGVPGLGLWFLLLASWFLLMFYNILSAKRRGDKGWEALFIWVSCYVGAILINASVDVALEGPMQGVWFWSLIGLGIGASMIFRYRVDEARGGPISGPIDG